MDNTQLNIGTGGDLIATDDVGGVKFQRIKLALGAEGVNDGDISATNPVPVKGPDNGAWSYLAGSSGTVVVPGGKRVTGIAARSTASGTLTINGGDTILVPAGALEIAPRGNLVAPALVFAGTDAYLVELVQ